MSARERSSRRLWRRSTGMSLLAGLVVLGAVVIVAEPASANQEHITGSQETFVNVMYQHARYENNARNGESVKMTSVDRGSGGTYSMGLRRPGVSASFAKATEIPEIGQTFTPFKSVSTGTIGNPPGTFYLTVSIVGGCGGDGCGTITWGAELRYNLPLH
jgi:hypothetical protein